MAWAVKTDAHTGAVTFRFDGKLTASEGEASAQACREVLQGSTGVHLVWDLRKMSGYDAAARRAWQDALWPRRAAIGQISVIGGGPLIRVGATTLALALGVPATFDQATAS